MSYAILHCSTDTNHFWQWEFYEEIAYHNLERTLPVFLAGRIKKNPFTHLLVINGPWWFSQLRIGCLCVNLLKSHYPELQIASRNKVDLGHWYHSTWILPQYEIMHIGMKKKLRRVNLKTKETTTIQAADPFADTHSNDKWLYCTDMIAEHLFLEEYPEYRNWMIAYGFDEKWLVRSCLWQTGVLAWGELFGEWKTTDYLMPEYMIDPTIG
jgi:hypothetical protein